MDNIMISRSDFIKICMDGDIDAINSAIIDMGLTDNSNKKKNKTYKKYLNNGLYAACLKGDMDIVNLMIDKGADYYDAGLEGACEGGHLNVIDLIIRKGANDRNCGLEGACKGGHIDIINLMIEHGANNWNWGLRGACEGGHLNIVHLMIEKGADIDNMNWGIYGACMGGHWNIFQFLMEKGVNNWVFGLRFACENGHLNIVNWMIERGANGDIGLYYACKGRHLNIVKILIENGITRWEYIFNIIIGSIDSDIVSLMVKNKVNFRSYIRYPRDKVKIFKLIEFGLPIDSLKDISGFNSLKRTIEDRRNTVRYILSDPLINDLTEIVIKYIVN